MDMSVVIFNASLEQKESNEPLLQYLERNMQKSNLIGEVQLNSRKKFPENYRVRRSIGYCGNHTKHETMLSRI